jgi:hypothetical protein
MLLPYPNISFLSFLTRVEGERKNYDYQESKSVLLPLFSKKARCNAHRQKDGDLTPQTEFTPSLGDAKGGRKAKLKPSGFQPIFT